MSAVIETHDLAKNYGKFGALHGLNLSMPQGSVFALVGANGAGKTTTIKILLNMLAPSRGHATVLGVDTRAIRPPVLAQVGYVSESQALPARLRVQQFFDYLRPCYPTWDSHLEQQLRNQLRLPPGRRINELSHGMRLKLALACAMAFRPRLLVLDEPFSGLDPVVRDDLVRGVLELAGEQQWTVFLSSHDLDEVERLVDTVGFLDAGRLLLNESFPSMSARFRRIEVTTPDVIESAAADALIGPKAAMALSGWIGVQHAGRVVRFVDTQFVDGGSESRARAAFAATRIETFPMTLREIFVAIVRERRERERERERRERE
jgi:ABC-2 type transport system ATP-binding protein